MEIMKLTTQNQTHNSDVTEFKIYPYGVTPPIDPQLWWFAIPVALGVLGIAYLVVKK